LARTRQFHFALFEKAHQLGYVEWTLGALQLADYRRHARVRVTSRGSGRCRGRRIGLGSTPPLTLAQLEQLAQKERLPARAVAIPLEVCYLPLELLMSLLCGLERGQELRIGQTRCRRRFSSQGNHLLELQVIFIHLVVIAAPV
jgi:hypothetical protein